MFIFSESSYYSLPFKELGSEIYLPSVVTEGYCLLSCDAMWAGRLLTKVFKKSAASLFKVEDSLVLEVKAAGSSKILLMIYERVQRHIPEDCNLHRHCWENLKFHEVILKFSTG